MSEFWQFVFVAGGLGLLLGTWWGRWAEANIWRGKCGDSVGHRTAVCSGGKFYYVVTPDEYLKVTPLPRENGQ